MCLEQLANFNKYQINATGRVITFQHHYIKELCKTQQRTGQLQLLDFSKCQAVENAHSYHPWFKDVSQNLFYIHHTDNVATAVAQAFVDKCKETDFDGWIQTVLPKPTPISVRSHINQDNFAEVLGIFWKRNIQEWKTNPVLIPIPIQELFNLTQLSEWVERLCNRPLSNPARLAAVHQMWLSKNSKLANELL